MSKLIDDYHALLPLLQELGFTAVAFSYPQRKRLGSSSLAWSDDSALMNFTTPELIAAVRGYRRLAQRFPRQQSAGFGRRHETAPAWRAGAFCLLRRV
jgi:hypothetical protein